MHSKVAGSLLVQSESITDGSFLVAGQACFTEIQVAPAEPHTHKQHASQAPAHADLAAG